MSRLLCALALWGAFWAVADGPKTLARLDFVRSPAAQETTAAREVIREAETALADGPWSVMDKDSVAASGDKHDYFSVPPYWWPNPDTPDGLPYVRKDGVVNPDRKLYDNVGLGKLCGAVETLALAHALTGEERYAARAAHLLKVWFLNMETRMNPHLNFAQGVPGRSKGRPEGIIDTVCFARLMDCLDLLAGAPGMSAEVLDGLRTWFGAYLDWLLTSPFGKWESTRKNNHATCYDVQAARIALFAGREDVAKGILAKAAADRIDKHVAPDGRQPEEMARTKSFDYTLKNLEALMDLADLARHFGIDLWGHTGPGGQSIQVALDFAVEYSLGGKPWPGENLDGLNLPRLFPLLQRGCVAYGLPRHRELLKQHAPPDWPSHRVHLWYPLSP